MSDAPLETLLRPFELGLLEWPSSASRVLFLRARDGWALQRFREAALTVTQPFKPEAMRLEASGFAVVSEEEALSSSYDVVFVLPPRSREEARALLAKASRALSSEGRIVACVSNNEGAKSAQSDLSALMGDVASDTKNKCRVFWSAPLSRANVDASLQSAWLKLDAVRAQKGSGLLTQPGIFSWEHIDPASQLLVDHMPSNIIGDVADLGAGIGYLGAELLKRNNGVRSLDSYEAQEQALKLAEKNLADISPNVPKTFHWHDVTKGLNKQYDFIISNPPFHAISRDGRPDVGQEFIRIAAKHLKRDGALMIVANRHLPYEQVLGAEFANVSVLGEGKGFKVILAKRE